MSRIFRRISLKWSVAYAREFALAHKAWGRHLAFAVVFAVVVLLIHREVYSFITQQQKYVVPAIETAVAPDWADSRGVEWVRVETGGATVLDPGLVERVARAFQACPWVRRVEGVERFFPNRLHVRLEYRRPHVAVRTSVGFAVVDPEGVRLPGLYETAAFCDRPTVLAGVSSRLPEPGKRWEDPGIAAGIAMADAVAASPLLARARIREIDVSNAGGRVDPGRSEIALVAPNGCMLYWGRAGSRFGDPTSEEKLEQLREVLAVYPDLEGLRYVKLYFRGSNAIQLREAHVQRPR